MAGRVLVVEDDRAVGEMLRACLVAASHDVDLVNRADRAENLIRSHFYDLVISDWRLPDGGDGMQIVHHAADRGMKTLVVSGYLFLLSNADKRHEYLMKPVRPAEFVVVRIGIWDGGAQVSEG